MQIRLRPITTKKTITEIERKVLLRALKFRNHFDLISVYSDYKQREKHETV